MAQRDMIDEFFGTPEPGTIFICIDPYHHYTPRPQQAMMIHRGGDTEDQFLRFVHSNIAAANLCSYVPDARLLRYDFPQMDEVPKPETMIPYSIYIEKVLLPYVEANQILPVRELLLRESVFVHAYHAAHENMPSRASLISSPEFGDFLATQLRREKQYCCNPEFRTPLIVAQTDRGCLIFSDTPVGCEGLRQYAQHIVDHYFDPHPPIHSLTIGEYPDITRQLVPFIDRSYTPGPLNNHHRFDAGVYTPPENLPVNFHEQLVPIISSDFQPSSEGFMGLAKYLHNWHVTQTPISTPNVDICRLLSIRECGYINIHAQPFSFDEAFRPLAEQLEQTTQVKAPEQLDPRRLESLMRETRELADHFLKAEFDVREHRSLVRMLEDPAEKMEINGIIIEQAAKNALLEKQTLYLPGNSCTDTPAMYAQLDSEKEHIFLSPNPASKKIYVVHRKNSYTQKNSFKPKVDTSTRGRKKPGGLKP